MKDKDMTNFDFDTALFNTCKRINKSVTHSAVTKVKVSAYEAGRADNRTVTTQFVVPKNFVAELGWTKGARLVIGTAKVDETTLYRIEPNVNGDWVLGETPNKGSFVIRGSGILNEPIKGSFYEETIKGSTLFLNS